MSRFRIFLVLFVVYTVAGIAGSYAGHIPVWFFCTGLFAFLAVLTIGVFNLSISFFMPVIHRGKRDGNMLLLTFDDGPDPVTTPEILRTLEKYNIRAVFFCTGFKMCQNPELVKTMVEKGHGIGNHTMWHSWKFTVSGTDRIVRELNETGQLIKEITGKETGLFRPPFGVSNPNIAAAVRKLKYKPVGWSIRSLDTVYSPEKVRQRVLNQLGPGKVILMHDNLGGTSRVLPEIIEGCISKGYRFGGTMAVLGI
jgi:peptidoglycan/xylan/chitin deacetylase (PgdA/CDA1 family)